MFNPRDRVVLSSVAKLGRDIDESFPYSQSFEYAHRKDHIKTILFPKWVYLETEKLVPIQTDATVVHPR